MQISDPHTFGTTLSYLADPAADEVARINRRYKTYWICFAAGIPMCLLCVGIFAVITGVVLHFMLLYQFWGLVQPSQECDSPGKAVGFSFIPFFSLYWRFVAIWGLAKELNRVRAMRGIIATPVNEQLALVGCILACCTLLIGLPGAIAVLVIDILVMNEMKNAAIDIIRADARAGQEPIPVSAIELPANGADSVTMG